MSNDDGKTGNAEPKKSKVGLVLGIVGGVVVLVAGGGAGLIFGPKLMGSSAAEAAPEAGAGGAATPAKPKGPPERIVSFKFDPIIVDVSDSDGRVHHLKVGLAAELAEGTLEEQFKLLQPRGRDAAITFLRSLPYEEVTNAKKFLKLKKDLSRRVSKAMGEDRIVRLLIIDFVAQ